MLPPDWPAAKASQVVAIRALRVHPMFSAARRVDFVRIANPGFRRQQGVVSLVPADGPHALAAPPDRLPPRQEIGEIDDRLEAPTRDEFAREIERRLVGGLNLDVGGGGRKRLEHLSRRCETKTIGHLLAPLP